MYDLLRHRRRSSSSSSSSSSRGDSRPGDILPVEDIVHPCVIETIEEDEGVSMVVVVT